MNATDRPANVHAPGLTQPRYGLLYCPSCEAGNRRDPKGCGVCDGLGKAVQPVGVFAAVVALKRLMGTLI